MRTLEYCLLAALAGGVTGNAQEIRHQADVLYVQKHVDQASADAAAQFKYFNVQIVSEGQVVKGAPYSAESVTETTQTLADGNRIHRTMNATVYRDSQGRTRREQAVPILSSTGANSQPAQIVTIVDPVAGVAYSLEPQTRTARKLPAPGQGLPVPPPPPHFEGAGGGAPVVVGMIGGGVAHAAGAPKSEPLGKRTIEGVECDGTRLTTTIPAGQIGNDRPIETVMERWYSAQLQTVVMSVRKDPMMGETTFRLTNINRSEPPASLFQVPADYTVKEGPPEGGVRIMRREVAPRPQE